MTLANALPRLLAGCIGEWEGHRYRMAGGLLHRKNTANGEWMKTFFESGMIDGWEVPQSRCTCVSDGDAHDSGCPVPIIQERDATIARLEHELAEAKRKRVCGWRPNSGVTYCVGEKQCVICGVPR